jgi:hypothetical protein
VGSERGPLPQWEQPHGVGSAVFESAAPDGRRWRLWAVDEPSSDAFPPGYRLAPVDDVNAVAYITAEHGLYFALDTAGLRVAADAVRADPEGARRQLGLDERQDDEGSRP